MLVSGNLPMSSADTASTIESDFFLIEMAPWMAARMPVTTTSSMGACAAGAAAGSSAAPAVPAAASSRIAQPVAVELTRNALQCAAG